MGGSNNWGGDPEGPDVGGATFGGALGDAVDTWLRSGGGAVFVEAGGGGSIGIGMSALGRSVSGNGGIPAADGRPMGAGGGVAVDTGGKPAVAREFGAAGGGDVTGPTLTCTAFGATGRGRGSTAGT